MFPFDLLSFLEIQCISSPKSGLGAYFTCTKNKLNGVGVLNGTLKVILHIVNHLYWYMLLNYIKCSRESRL